MSSLWALLKKKPSVAYDREFQRGLRSLPLGVVVMLETGLVARRAGRHAWVFWRVGFQDGSKKV